MATSEIPASTPAQRNIRLTAQQAAALDRKRRFKDRLVNWFIVLGGIFILFAILTIFLYLLSQAWQLFKPTSAMPVNTVVTTTAASPRTGFVTLDERNQIGMRLLPNGTVQFIDAHTGQPTGSKALTLPPNTQISRVQQSGILQGLVGVGLSNGQLLVFKPTYQGRQGADGKAETLADVTFPYGTAPLTVHDGGEPLTEFAIRDTDDSLQVLSNQGNQLHFQVFAEGGAAESSGGLVDEANPDQPAVAPAVGGLVDEANATPAENGPALVRSEDQVVPLTNTNAVRGLYLGQGGRWAFALTADNQVTVLRQQDGQYTPYQTVNVSRDGSPITAASPLQGEISMLFGSAKGRIDQWFMVRQPQLDAEGNEQYQFTPIRHFQLGSSPITVLGTEQRRKGILAGDQQGNVGYFYSTSERVIDKRKIADTPITAVALSTHSDGMLADATGSSTFLDVDAKHPDVSFQSLWGKVWYESYPKPDYVWQSSSGNQDFEAKLSLMPLTFGTLKAAFWAMILAIPLAIAAAMYTAAFMAPSLRTKIKPTIELMQALPTVILGFLAGLWLAPLVTDHLLAVFLLMLILPLVMLLCGFLWMQMPLERRNSIPDGIAPMILLLPLVLTFALVWYFSQPLEHMLFASNGGSLVKWLATVGIDYQSQNALIVGLIMGFAVIAPIYSIAEDALFAVPRHLVNGSLALGATPWQTLTRVVLPTASPGIFSAVMIGFGRAVGETMIVLMATGNTPIMDLNLFNGMRTLSANLAVEMGEAELGSTHLRVLFLSALVLFILTFLVNTVAEVVRNRLRKKYGSL